MVLCRGGRYSVRYNIVTVVYGGGDTVSGATIVGATMVWVVVTWWEILCWV